MGYGILSGTPVGASPEAVGFLPLLALFPIYATYKAGQLAVQAVQTAKGTSTDEIQPTVDAFKACANQMAVKSGYRAVPAGPLLGKTCGLANDPASTGCPSRDLLIRTCTERGIAPEPLVRMTLEEANAVQVAEEAEEKPFLRTSTALYLGLGSVAMLVYLQRRRQKKAERSLAQNRRRPNRRAR